MSVMATETNKITLLTADEEEFVVDEAIAMEFGTVKTYYEDNPDSCDEAIPLPNVTSKYLAKVIEYYKWHYEEEEDEEAKAFDEALVEYVRKVFGIENDYTPEEEAELRKQNEWAFEDLDPDDN
ncbi:hypothetical protein ERO13_A01G100100v2 [Gossypium hirsutum]|nr:hypothetical protein ERO13_A01G100100v2 [Gossypium hirsutum]